MTSLLHDVELDWRWPSLTEVQREIARRHEALLRADRQGHSVESVEAALLAAAAELPGVLIRARAVDDQQHYGWQVVYPADEDESRALGAEIYPCDEFDEAGMFPGELTVDDFRAAGVTSVLTPVAFPDSMLRAIEQRGWIYDSADSLSTLVAGAWQLAADDLPAGFRTPEGPRRVQSIYLPVEIWAELHDRAKAEERTVSYLVQRAVTAAYELPVE